MVLLVSEQCRHSIKFAIFKGIDKSVFKDRKEFTGSLFTQLADVYKLIDFYKGTKVSFYDLIRTDKRDYPEDAMGIGSTHALNIIKEMIENNLIKKAGNSKNALRHKKSRCVLYYFKLSPYNIPPQ